jgi:hypothetical protein
VRMGREWNWLKILMKGVEPSGSVTKELVVKFLQKSRCR